MSVEVMMRDSAVESVVGSHIAEHPWLDRLDGISFLGTLDAQADSGTPSTRLDHAWAVARLGLAVGQELGVSAGLVREFVAACLLHDLGHFPLSHSIEAAFARAFDGDHHRVTRWLIVGNGPIPYEHSLAPALVAEGLGPEALWSLVAGEGSANPLASLLASHLNVDTLEGIPRAARQFGRDGVSIELEGLFGMRDGMVYLTPRGVGVMDAFWSLKHHVYRDIVHRPCNLRAQHRLSERLVAEWTPVEPWPGLLTLDDARLLADLGASGLSDAIGHPPLRPVAYHPREYKIDTAIQPGPHGLPAPAWNRRYVHRRWQSSTDGPAMAAEP